VLGQDYFANNYYANIFLYDELQMRLVTVKAPLVNYSAGGNGTNLLSLNIVNSDYYARFGGFGQKNLTDNEFEDNNVLL
jgi:hypothetical protein